MKVSVVLPAYNAAFYLKEAVNSVLQQTIPVFELLIVNDGSTDNTQAICDQLVTEYPHKIRVISLIENQGVSVARNTGCAAAKAPWILFLDADDVLPFNLIAEAKQRLEKNPERESIEVIFSAYQYINHRTEVISKPVRFQNVKPQELLGYLIVRNFLVAPGGVFVRKMALEGIGGFQPGLALCEDWLCWLKLAERCQPWLYLETPLVKVRRHEHNTSQKASLMQQSQNNILNQFKIDTLYQALHSRELPWVQNQLDYISLLYRLGHNVPAEANLNALILQYPQYKPAYFYRGLFLLKHQSLSLARQAFALCYEYDSTHLAAQNNMAVLYALEGNVALAQSHLDIILQQAPQYLDAQYNLNVLYTGQKLALDHFKITQRELRNVLTPYI